MTYSDLILRFSAICRESPSARITKSKLLDFDFAARQKGPMESTPPPLPSTPSQPPRKNWWTRNWKWFVPTGCLTLIALGVLSVVCIVFFVFSVMKASEPYKLAVARAESDERVLAALGTPISEGMFTSGKANVNGPSGEADLAIPISGPKGKATIYAVGTKSAGKWEFSKLAVQSDGGQTIDLNKNAEATNESKEESETEEATTDERVESVTLARENGNRLQPVDNFKPADNPQHVVVKLTEGAEGTHVKTVWTNLNAGGAKNQKLWTKELTTDEENRSADFSLSNSNSKLFPIGDYKIDIYLDNELIQTVRYKVQ
jgi:Cytochrome oxidase complex assembly protein 1